MSDPEIKELKAEVAALQAVNYQIQRDVDHLRNAIDHMAKSMEKDVREILGWVREEDKSEWTVPERPGVWG